MRPMILLAALAAPAAAVAAEPVQPSGLMVTTESDALYKGATEIYRLEAANPSPKALVARLERLCESKRRRDQQHCATAWARINAEYARMQAKRAAQD